MAQKGLHDFLEAFMDNIEAQPDLKHLREQYNFEPIVFIFEPKDLSDIMLLAAKAQEGWTPTTRDINFIKKNVKTWGQKLRVKIQGLGGEPYGEGGVRLRFTIGTNIKAQPAGWQIGQAGSYKEAYRELPQSSYNKIKEAYRGTIQGYFKECQKFFGTDAEGNDSKTGTTAKGKAGKGGLRDGKGSRMQAKSAGNIYHQGHEKDAGIAETSILRAMQEAFSKQEQALRNLGLKDLKAVNAMLSKLKINLSVIRADDKEGFETRLEYSGGNVSSGGTSGDDRAKFLAACKKTLDGLGKKLGSIEGSDSIIQRNRKLIIKSVVKEFKKSGRVVKVKTENIKLNESKGKGASKRIGKAKVGAAQVITAGAAAGIVPKGTRRATKRKTSPPRMGIKNILGVLNSQLPKTVMDNMGEPRLENRTGKFAQSVRAVDVTETAQGFKSIGYTYSKSPYQVFESGSGSRFSSIERDPRTLIDTSIREIVAQFGLGRLYTRRL